MAHRKAENDEVRPPIEGSRRQEIGDATKRHASTLPLFCGPMVKAALGGEEVPLLENCKGSWKLDPASVCGGKGHSSPGQKKSKTEESP